MRKKNKLGCTFWLTGLSSSGKTTLGHKLFNELNKHSFEKIVFLDGDILRNNDRNYDYTNQGREAIGIRKAQIAKAENIKGKDVIITGIAAKKSWRSEYRKIIPNYFEIYIKCASDVCARRDKKNIYSKAFKGEYSNFVGITESYEESEKVELVIDTYLNNLQESYAILLNYVKQELNKAR